MRPAHGVGRTDLTLPQRIAASSARRRAALRRRSLADAGRAAGSLRRAIRALAAADAARVGLGAEATQTRIGAAPAAVGRVARRFGTLAGPIAGASETEGATVETRCAVQSARVEVVPLLAPMLGIAAAATIAGVADRARSRSAAAARLARGSAGAGRDARASGTDAGRRRENARRRGRRPRASHRAARAARASRVDGCIGRRFEECLGRAAAAGREAHGGNEHQDLCREFSMLHVGPPTIGAPLPDCTKSASIHSTICPPICDLP